ncbi:uncharacterized protein LOC129779285 [Toxorhynchites rutilus septentrionalis]|uniref:uncharacterized protein LOC129779285 n=1 Tax=Toxorhynchites rutilus septentrionalis TaxID=329112 RepID=UPI002479800A|nr:uncharacterized protein LOC129779285 [Toxorhynchites rutilus septentrionalis]
MPKRSLATTDEELRTCHLHQEVLILRTPIVYERFSNWNRLLHATAYHIVDSLEGLKAAEILLWKLIQSEVYPDELTILTKNKTVPICERLILEKSSPLRMLTPMLDDEGVLRVDSRISAAQGVAEDVKFPVILPRKHHVTNLIVDNFHRKLLHGNSETVVNEIRQQFYIAHLRTVVRDIEKRCQRCKVMKAKPSTPRMGPLPEARLSPGVRPFTYIGIDYFGPILVKYTLRLHMIYRRRAVSPVYVASSVAEGHRKKYTPTMVGTLPERNEFCKTKSSGSSRMQLRCSPTPRQNGSSFRLPVPIWGSWERMVRSIKNAMKSIPQDDKLDDEGLQTVLVEAEGIVNSRPLTYLPLDSAEREALTPNHFILGSSSGVVQPITKLEDSANELNASWNLVQKRIDHFWRRWVREYLPTLTKRTKWVEETKPVQPGDLVIVIDDSRRNGWIRGRIVEVTPGSDGRIRQALVQTSSGLFRRPVSKLAVLDVDRLGEIDGSIHSHGEGNVCTITAPATRPTAPSL